MSRMLFRAMLLATGAFMLPLACRTAPQAADRPAPIEVEYEVLFAEPDHQSDWCLKALAANYAEVTDSTIFYDRDTLLRIKVPAGAGKESYHAHLLHWLDDRLVEHLAVQGGDGTIEIPITKFARPETLIVTSASMRMHEKAKTDGLLMAPYSMSFRLVERESASTLVRVQPFRYEWKHPYGTAYLFVQTFNRSDMLLNLLDLEGRAGFLFTDGYYHFRTLDGFLTSRIVVDVLNAKGDVVQRAGTYAVLDTACGEKPLSLRVLGKELVAFDPPARVTLSLAEDQPTTSAIVSARFEGLRPKSRVHFVLAAGYPIGMRDRVGVRVQSDVVTAEKPEGSYVVSLDDLDPSSFPMTGYVAHRLAEPWMTPGGFYAPCEPLGRFEGVQDDGLATLHAKMVLPRFASHYDVIRWLGNGRGPNEAKKFLLAYWAAGGVTNVPTSGVGTASPIAGTSTGSIDTSVPSWGPSPNILPPPTAISDPAIPGNTPGNSGTDTGPTPGLTTGATNGAPFLWGPPGFCGCFPGGINCGRNTNLNPADEGECAGKCGVNCPANGHCKNAAGGAIEITLRCQRNKNGCEKDPRCEKAGFCVCVDHMWTRREIEQGIRSAVKGKNVADIGWYGAHGDSSPCHTMTPIGFARVSYWGNGFQVVHAWYKVFVTFLPCHNLGQGGGGGGGGKKPGEDERRDDGIRRVQPPTSSVEDEDGSTLVPSGTGQPVQPNPRWNPSTDPNVVGHVMDLVGAFRSGLGLSALPRPTGILWSIPTEILMRTPDQLSHGGAALAQWYRDVQTAYWGRKERTPSLGSAQLRDVLSDLSIYSGAARTGTAGTVGGSHEAGSGPIR